MYGKLVKITVKPGKRDQLLEFLRHDAAVAYDAEPGTLRFDVWDVPTSRIRYISMRRTRTLTLSDDTNPTNRTSDTSARSGRN
jgi:hypothetical protein